MKKIHEPMIKKTLRRQKQYQSDSIRTRLFTVNSVSFFIFRLLRWRFLYHFLVFYVTIFFSRYLISILIIDCRYLSVYRNFTFQLQNKPRTFTFIVKYVSKSLLINGLFSSSNFKLSNFKANVGRGKLPSTRTGATDYRAYQASLSSATNGITVLLRKSGPFMIKIVLQDDET